MELFKKNELFLLEEIVKKNFAAKYKDSYLGILWSVLKPLLIMILLTIIFSTLFSRNIDNFPVYYLSGKCLYDFLNNATAYSMDSIKGNKHILKRTAAPKYIFVLGSVISEFINFIITLIILIGVMIATNAPFYFNIIPLAIIPLISLIIGIIGIALIVSILCVHYTDIKHLWSVISLMLMYASALFYPMDIIPEPFYSFMVLNPFYWIINQFRNFAIWGTFPNVLNTVNSLLLSSIILIIGIIVFKKYEKGITMKF